MLNDSSLTNNIIVVDDLLLVRAIDMLFSIVFIAVAVSWNRYIPLTAFDRS